VALTSDFRHCRVVLGAQGLRVVVTFPLLVGTGRGADGGEEKAHTYVWHRQAFSASSPPPRWAAVVGALREAAGSGGPKVEGEGEGAAAAGAEAGGGGGGPEGFAPDAPLKVIFPEARRDATPRWADFEEGNWWLDPAAALFPPDEAVELEWTPEALFHCVRGPDGAPEIEVVWALTARS